MRALHASLLLNPLVTRFMAITLICWGRKALVFSTRDISGTMWGEKGGEGEVKQYCLLNQDTH